MAIILCWRHVCATVEDYLRNGHDTRWEFGFLLKISLLFQAKWCPISRLKIPKWEQRNLVLSKRPDNAKTYTIMKQRPTEKFPKPLFRLNSPRSGRFWEYYISLSFPKNDAITIRGAILFSFLEFAFLILLFSAFLKRAPSRTIVLLLSFHYWALQLFKSTFSPWL